MYHSQTKIAPYHDCRKQDKRAHDNCCNCPYGDSTTRCVQPLRTTTTTTKPQPVNDDYYDCNDHHDHHDYFDNASGGELTTTTYHDYNSNCDCYDCSCNDDVRTTTTTTATVTYNDYVRT